MFSFVLEVVEGFCAPASFLVVWVLFWWGFVFVDRNNGCVKGGCFFFSAGAGGCMLVVFLRLAVSATAASGRCRAVEHVVHALLSSRN